MKKQTGLTLIELMIVVAIVAIIASIAYPSYQDQMRKTRRADGQSALLDAAARQERFYTEFGRYTATMGNLSMATISSQAFYSIAITAGGGQTFTLSATGQNDQANDKCGVLSINQAGVKGDSGGYGTKVCW